MGLSRRKGILAFAKQAAIGTPASAPDYSIPIIGGGIKDADDRADLPFTRDTAARPGQYKQRAWGGGTIRVPMFPDPMGLLIYEAMGAQNRVPGVGGPASLFHFTMDDDLISTPLTMWNMVGNDWYQFDDAFITRLALRGNSGENGELEMDVISWQVHPVGAPTLPTLHGNTPRYKYIGSTVKLSPDDGTPDEATEAQTCLLTIDRAPERRHGTKLTPSSLTPERQISMEATVTYDADVFDWDFVHSSAFGSVTGDSLDQGIGHGSFFVEFGRHPEDATRFLRYYTGSEAVDDDPPYPVNWEYRAERPDSDPAGGSLEYTVIGPVIDPGAGGSEVTIALANDVAGAY